MPSKTFQPLLFDSFKFKLPKTTYVDHYGKKSFSSKKNKRVYSGLGPRTNSSAWLSQKEKMALLTKRSRPFTSTTGLDEKYRDEYANFEPICVTNSIEKNGVNKTATKNVKIRAIIDDYDQPNKTQFRYVSPPPPPQSQSILSNVNLADEVANDEQLANLTQNVLQLDDNPPQRNIQSNDSHWFIYPEENTPEYIIEAKKRLNQIKQPHLVANTKTIKQVRIFDEPAQAEQQETTNVDEKRHWLTWPNPSTPENVKEIRRRLGHDNSKKMVDLKSMIRRPKSSFHSSSSLNYEEVLNRPKTATAAVTFIEEPTVVTTTTEIDPFNQFVSYEPVVTQLNDINVTTKTITTGQQHMPTYEQLLDDSLNRKNYFDTQNNNVYYGGCGRGGGQTNGEFINYSVDDPFLASSGQMSNSEMPFEAWVNSANDNDRDAVLRIINRVGSSSGSHSKPPQYQYNNDSRLSNHSSVNQSNQYVRVKAKQPHPLPVHLRSLIDVNPKQQFFRAKSSSGTRKLGSVRNTYRLRDEENLEKFLLNNNLLSNQMNG